MMARIWKSLPCSPAVACLVAMCVADALVSALLFHHQVAVEANPLLRPSAEAGLFQFLGAKGLTFIPSALYLEWFHRRDPRRASLFSWAACAAYAALYVGGGVMQLVMPN